MVLIPHKRRNRVYEQQNEDDEQQGGEADADESGSIHLLRVLVLLICKRKKVVSIPYVRITIRRAVYA